MKRLPLLLPLLLTLASCDILGGEEGEWREPEPNHILFFSDESGSWQLYSMAPDGSDVQRLTYNPGFPLGDVAFSPDGRKVVLTGEQIGEKEPDPAHGYAGLYIMGADGSNRRPLLEYEQGIPNSASGQGPLVWSPDSKQLIFHRQLLPEALGLFEPLMANSDGTDVRRVTQIKEWKRISDWSPDGRLLLGSTFTTVYDSTGSEVENGQLFKMDLQGNVVEVLGDASTNYHAPFWSSDGSQIAFTNRNRFARLDTLDDYGTLHFSWSAQEEIYLMNEDGSGMQKLTNSEYESVSPVAWSPDDTQILAMATNYYPEREQSAAPAFTYHILLANADGSGIKEITPFPEATCKPIGWSWWR